MKKIILTSHKPQGLSIENMFKEFKIPFYKETVQAADLKILEYTAIAPDNTARNDFRKTVENAEYQAKRDNDHQSDVGRVIFRLS